MIRIRETGVLVTEQEFRDSLPKKSLPDPLRAEDLDGNGADIVFEGPQPVASQYQSVVPNGVVQINGNWHTAFTLRDWAQDEIDAAMAGAKATFIKKVDADVDAIYADAIGNRGPEYLDTEQDALAFKAGGYVGTAPESIMAWATPNNQTAQWATDDILATATAWRGAKAQIRNVRLAVKKGAETAANASAFAVFQNQWTSFVTTLREELGLQ